MRPEQRPAGDGRSPREYTDYIRLSALGLQMAGTVIGAFLLGHWIDGLTGWRFPVFTVLLALLGLVGAMLQLFRATGRRNTGHRP
jgi:MFS family permease